MTQTFVIDRIEAPWQGHTYVAENEWQENCPRHVVIDTLEVSAYDSGAMASIGDLTITVAKLEERITNHIKFFWVVVAFGFLWMAVISGKIYNTPDHLSFAVSQLNNGKSSEQVKQGLSVITAQANLLQVEGKPPSKGTAKELSTASRAVASAITKYPQYPEVWKAASSLVNLRSLSAGESDIPEEVAAKVGPPIPNQGDCFAVPTPSELPPMPPSLNNHSWTVQAPWHDCTLRLDDVEGFERSTLMSYLREKVGVNRELISIELTLVRVNVVYGGGPVIPVRLLIFYDCRFGFDVPPNPSERGRDLLEAILSKGYEDRELRIKIPTA